jgi:hypothetical protein
MAPRGKIVQESESLKFLKQCFKDFVVTMKNLALYPATSQTNLQALTSLHQLLHSYMKAHGPLIVFVVKDGLHNENAEKVYEEKLSDPILSFPLFRDGIQSIIFEPTLTETELRSFINIMLRFRTTTESDQDDVVTALWEASLSSIKYTIADEYETVDPEFEIGALKVAAAPDPDRPDIDAPWQASAPVEVDGASPVAKSVNSLFSFADSLDFSHAPGGTNGKVEDPHEGGKLLDDDYHEESRDPLGEYGAYPPDDSRNDGYEEGDQGFLSSPKANGIPGTQNLSDHGENTLEGEMDSDQAASNPWGDDAMGSLDLSDISLDDENTEMQAQATLGVDEELVAGRAERLKYWGLSSREIKQISAFLQWEEARSKTYSVLEVVSIIIRSPILKSSMRPFLVSFTLEEIKSAVGSLTLAHANLFISELKELAKKPERKTARLILQELLQKMDDPEILSSLSQVIDSDQVLEGRYDSLRYFLYQLPPTSISTIAETVNNARSLTFKKLLLELMAYFIITYELENLPKIVSTLNEWAIQELLTLFQGFRRPVPQALLSSLVKSRSPQVREAAAQYILTADPESTQLLAPMIVDQNPKLRKLVTPPLTSRRDPLVENAILEHLSGLSRQKSTPDEEETLLELYRTLGLSASSRSLGYLEEILLKKDFKTLFERGGDIHRVGAALALHLMPEASGSAQILSKASRSAFRNIRFAYKEAAKILNRE